MNIYKYIENLTKNPDKIRNKTLNSNYIGYPKLDQLTHENLAKSLHDEEACCYSIIVVSDSLDNNFCEDSNYMKRTNNIIISKALEDIRKKITNKWYDKEKINHLLNKYKIPLNADNYTDEKVHRKYLSNLEDGVLEMQQQIELFNYLTDLKEACRWKYDEEGWEIGELSKEEAEELFKQSLEEVLMPRVYSTYERIYDLPYPLNSWDQRNIFQHWFFIEKENDIQFVRGGSGGSMQRHLLGLYSHAFAYLENKYNQKCPTGIWKYNSKNKMELYEEFSTHKTFLIDLVGNYKPSENTIDALFNGKLLNYELNWDNGIVEIKK